MATYVIVNLIILGSALLALWVWGALRFNKTMAIVIVMLLIMTAIFDSLIITFDLCAYNPDHILGIYIIKAPVEDFFYSIAAGVVIPNIWHKLGDIRAKN